MGIMICQIDANFNVWVLPSRPKASDQELPLLGCEDPSVSLYSLVLLSVSDSAQITQTSRIFHV